MAKTRGENNGGAAWRLTRSKILLAFGLLGAFHETVVAQSPRPYLLLLFASMMGLASLAKLDDIINKRGITISFDKPERPSNESEPEPVNGGP
jgi:hypothetical protein